MKNIIKEKGPILSSDILEIVTSRDKTLSKVAARKRLSRVNGDIYKLKGMFTDGQILFYSLRRFSLYNRERW